jgi:hypothetical protein
MMQNYPLAQAVADAALGEVTRRLNEEEGLTEAELNSLGTGGWELVGVFADSSFVHFYFKRLVK